MTWIEIADTAIKIGLGAVIAGAFGYLTNKRTNEAQGQARYSERRRDHIERILTALTELENRYAHHRWRVMVYRFYKIRNKLEEANKYELEEKDTREKLYQATEKWRYISGVLLLLGERRAEKNLGLYKAAINDWLSRSDIEPMKCTDELIEEMHAAVESAREDFYQTLSSAYEHS